jgi:hypothetical protein
MPRHLPPPWKAEKIAGGFAVRDANGQALAYVYSRATETDAMQAKGPDRRRGATRRPQHCATAGAAGAQRMKVAKVFQIAQTAFHDLAQHCIGSGATLIPRVSSLEAFARRPPATVDRLVIGLSLKGSRLIRIKVVDGWIGYFPLQSECKPVLRSMRSRAFAVRVGG